MYAYVYVSLFAWRCLGRFFVVAHIISDVIVIYWPTGAIDLFPSALATKMVVVFV